MVAVFVQMAHASKETVFFFHKREDNLTGHSCHCKDPHMNTGSASGTQKGVSFHVI